MSAVRAALILMAITAAVVSARPPAAAPGAPAGAWAQFRGDAALSGRSRARGRITAPAVLWQQFIGARQTLLRVQPGRSTRLQLPLPQKDSDAGRAGETETAW